MKAGKLIFWAKHAYQEYSTLLISRYKVCLLNYIKLYLKYLIEKLSTYNLNVLQNDLNINFIQ